MWGAILRHQYVVEKSNGRIKSLFVTNKKLKEENYGGHFSQFVG